jgi:hypothetical protein
MNNKGQFSIIAALLVAVILITTVIITYSTIRSSPVQNQPPILSAIDETNLAIKQILGFAIGYYDSVLQVTGNVSYAKTSATDYLQSGLLNIANMNPQWGTSLNLTSFVLQAYWFTSTSYSTGNLTVNYDLAGLGIRGINYQTSCELSVQIINGSTNGQACLSITQDENDPLVTLGKQNLNFYRYNNASSTWELTNPNAEPTAYSNGTYVVNVPSGVNSTSYVVQVKDKRGIIVVASSFNSYAVALRWNSTSVSIGSPSGQYYVSNYNSTVDSIPDFGTHSNFASQQNTDSVYDSMTEANAPIISGETQQFVQSNTSDVDGNGYTGTESNFTTEQYSDNINDTLTEANVITAVPETYVYGNNNQNPGSWTNPNRAYDNSTINAATKASPSSGTWSGYIVVNLTTTTVGTKIRYMIGRSSNGTDLWTTMTVNVANQTGSWWNVYNSTPTYASTTYQNLTFPSTMTYTAIEFQFYRSGGSSWQTVSLYETQVVNATYTPPPNYQLDLERQWTSAPYNVNGSKLLCIRTGTLNAEALEVDVWTGGWTVLNSSLVTNAWNNISVSSYLTNANFIIRFIDGTRSGDASQSTWQIDSVLIHTWNITDNYKLNLEEQWANANYTNAQLCMKTGSFNGSETLAVDAWNASANAWTNVLSSLNVNSWNNVTISAYLQSSTFTIRFRGTGGTPNSIRNSWQIDSALLAVFPITDLYSLSRSGVIVAELLQNGTIRWLGQNLVLASSSSTMPFPPMPVRSIHVNETINGMNGEVPFQIEDWSSSYRIPLGLTSNMSIFSGTTMLVFLATPNASKVTIWWNGSDMATQTPFAYTNKYFSDSPSSGIISNGITKLQIQGNFVVTSTVGSSSSTANFMRINTNSSEYGSLPSYVITNGTVRDIIHQEAEWDRSHGDPIVGGVSNCSDIYADIVLTLPANATYYTYQLSLMFVQSQQNRTINDLCPVWLTSLTGQAQTENGTTNGLPNVSNASDLFYNYSASAWAHHWSQSISGASGTGIMFTDNANQNLYLFDSIKGVQTGALGANSTTQTIQLLPVTKTTVSFSQTLDPRMQDIIWYGAIATFDATAPPIYNNSNQTGLWMIVEYPPTVAVTAQNY